MNAEVQNVFNEDAISAAVAAAIAGYKAKNVGATEADIALKRAEIVQNIMSSRIKDKFLNSKANRTARKAHVLEEAVNQKVNFYYVEELVVRPKKFTVEELGLSKWPLVAVFLEEFLNGVKIPEEIVRKVTLAVRTEDAEGDYKKISYALAVQNPDDEEDSLIGREYALSRFANGQVVVKYLPPSLVKQFPLPKALEALVDAGCVNEYFEKFPSKQ
jgi:hypothetical protein